MNAPSSIILRHGAQSLANYPHAKRVGNMIYLSGCLSRLPDGTPRGIHLSGSQVTTDIGEQTRGAIEAMRLVLQEVGSDLSDLVDVTIFLTSMKYYDGFNSVYNDYFTADNGPSRTTVAVADLPGNHFLIEIKGVAVIPTKSML